VAELARIAALIEGARQAVVFTGAGISTESGIPDFRSPGGIWSRYRPIDFREFVASPEARREYWQRKFAMDPVIEGAEPNRGHRAVAALIQSGKARAVITQNIDGLHQRSGVPDARVVELHGNSTYARCLSCAADYALAPLREAFERDGEVPPCADCGGLIKAATISFGQPMPEAAMKAAEAHATACDLFLSLGSSLVVQPAASFPAIAKHSGAALAIVNREPTPLDELADLVVCGEIGAILGAAVGIA
jgi:NAD-dependent deacetylase